MGFREVISRLVAIFSPRACEVCGRPATGLSASGPFRRDTIDRAGDLVTTLTIDPNSVRRLCSVHLRGDA